MSVAFPQSTSLKYILIKWNIGKLESNRKERVSILINRCMKRCMHTNILISWNIQDISQLEVYLWETHAFRNTCDPSFQ